MEKAKLRILASDGEPPRVTTNLTLPRSPAAQAGAWSIQPASNTRRPRPFKRF